MEFDAYTAFEIRAEAFRLMTGHMAPGKSAAPLSYPAPYEERAAAFEEWSKQYGACINAVIRAAESVLPDTQ